MSVISMKAVLFVPVSVGITLASVSVSMIKLAILLVISATCLASDDWAKPSWKKRGSRKTTPATQANKY